MGLTLPHTFTGGGYQVTVNKDRSIVVKQGDWLSKYAMAIWGNYSKPYIDKFCRGFKKLDGTFVRQEITNKDLIRTGEILYHPDRLPGEDKPDADPKDPKPGTGKICRRVALLTCVSNDKGIGPGHSAVVVDDEIFTFERVAGGWLVPNGSGWVRYKSRDYLKINTWRPLVPMELDRAKTNATAVYDYIMKSDRDDADYGGSGLCSHLAAKAISAGLGWDINPWGLNTPAAVANLVKNSGAVSASYYTFPDAGDGTNLTDSQKRAMAMLFYAFRDEWSRRREPPGILKWT
jgi:hypothetical protein